MEKKLVIEVTLRPSTADANDTTGLIMGDASSLSRPGTQVLQIPTIPAPVIVVPRLPGPPPVDVQVNGEDVQGYLWWYGAIVAGTFMAGYGIGSAYGDLIGYDKTYHKGGKQSAPDV